MKQQTAIEWLIEQTRTPEWHSLKRGDIIEKAKEIEKEQIEKAVVFGNRQDFYDGTEEIGSNYYNLTYTQSSE